MDKTVPHIHFNSLEMSDIRRPPREPSPDYMNTRSPSVLKKSSPVQRPNKGKVAFQSNTSTAKLHREDSEAEDQHNLAHTETLNEATILRILEERFHGDIIQTYIGEVLIIINPYKSIDIYGDKHHEMYKNITRQSDQDPHLYWLADRTYQRMIDTTRKQCILVNGESGAGKTEATKSLLKHLVYISQSSVANLHERVVKVNPILEAFGNAQTVMNHNSSRFGKFVEVIFRLDGQLTGACIHDYLLEKSRVIHLGPQERNFHVFYYMFAGMPEETLRYYYLEDPMAHRILKREDRSKSVFHNIEDREHCRRMFIEMESELSTVGFDADDIATIYSCLSAVLFITNIQFHRDEDSDGTYITDEYPAIIVADLLSIDMTDLATSLISRTSIISGEEVVILKSLEQANDERDAVAKAVYSRLFGWIVRKINSNLSEGSHGSHLGALTIGILDLSGFENFIDNSFEQLCINVANEKLQYFFNTFIFATEQAIYAEEGIDWSNIEFRNNDGILRLFLGEEGVTETGTKKMIFTRQLDMFTILDDESKSPRATDACLVRSWCNHLGDHPNFSRIDGDELGFCIIHYADQVIYNASKFVEKNRDRLSANLLMLLQKSENDFVRDLFLAVLDDTGVLSRTKSRIRSSSKRNLQSTARTSFTGQGSVSGMALKRLKARARKQSSGDTLQNVEKTIAQHFKKSLVELMGKMTLADPIFVRCIKPNIDQRPDQFSRKLVARQLEYSGVLEIAKIARVGYPVRMALGNFIKRYKGLCSVPCVPADPARACKNILHSAGISREHYAIGNTKVFLKAHVADWLNVEVRKMAAACIQRTARGHLARRRYASRREAEREREERWKEGTRREMEAKTARLDLNCNRNAPKLADATLWQEMSIIDEEEDEICSTSVPGSPDQGITSHPPLTANAALHPGTEGSIAPQTNLGDTVSLVTMMTTDDDNGSSCSDSSSECDSDDMNWDIAKLVPRDRMSPSESFGGLVKGLRVLTYALLFILVLLSATSATVCVLWLEAGMLQEGDVRSSSRSQLLWIICVPHAIIFLSSFTKTIFGHMLWPPPKMFILILMVELLNTLGLVLLVFAVLPNFSTLSALGFMCCVAVLPSALKLILIKRGEDELWIVMLKSFVNLTAFVIQVGAVVFAVYVRHAHWGMLHWAATETRYQIKFSGQFYWVIPLAFVLASLKWWENFVPARYYKSSTESLGARVVSFKFKLLKYRTKMSTVVSLWNILLSIAFMYLIELSKGQRISVGHLSPFTDDDDDKSNGTASNGTGQADDHAFVTSLLPVIVQIFSALICYYFGGLACKLKMQNVSFCLPLMLSLPLVALVVGLQCNNSIDETPTFGGILYESLCNDFDASFSNGFYVIGGVIWWLSLLWICGHVWYSRSERLAKSEKLFVTRLYTGPLVVPSLLLNRRNDLDDVVVAAAADPEMPDAADILSRCRSVKYGLLKEVQPEPSKLAQKAAKDRPVIYACATMWHETRQEIIQLLKSVFRMDADQMARWLAMMVYHHDDPDYYDFEAHIFFDDAMEVDDEENRVPNIFVQDFCNCINEAASSVIGQQVALRPPTVVSTPYGGRLTWILPGGTPLVTHLKDKTKIRHLKRWSQVMYMYYLLGYKLFGLSDTDIFKTNGMDGAEEAEADTSQAPDPNRRKESIDDARKRLIGSDHFAKGLIFSQLTDALVTKAENTFLLALDGDVDFKPDAVRLLVDRMRKNCKTGAACGRIHPIGAGPMVWYQVFEYAIGHWFQKSTEHVLGCVLCSPGCFSLFRGSALLDDNVMKRYTVKPTEAVHYLQYDQGEDRWLCTLLLQQGYRVDYTAASDALTYAPEGFNEFFNQRRRWTPSTMANIIDLLSTAGDTVRMNDNISWFYMFYQGGLMGATVLGPATVILAIATAFETVLKIAKWEGYVMALMPVVFQLIISFTTKKNTQLLVCAFLSTFYACVMTVVAVGILKGLVTDGVLDPSLIFLTIMSGSFILAGIMHPYEFTCLLYGIIYYLCIPSGYLVLIIFAFSNMQDISWGTRDVPKKKTKAQLEEEKKHEEEQLKKKKRGWFSFLNFDSVLKEVRETAASIFSERKSDNTQVEMLKTLRHIRKDMKKINNHLTGSGATIDTDSDSEDDAKTVVKEEVIVQPIEPQEIAEPEPDIVDQHRELYEEDLDNPAWINKWEGEKEVDYLDIGEAQFWKQLIKKYLKPIKKDAKFEKKVFGELIELRNNVSFAYWLINGLWILFNYMVQTTEGLKDVDIMGKKTQPLGFIFMILFMVALGLQFIGMLMHRWGTFLQLIAITELSSPFKKKQTMQGGTTQGMQRNMTVRQAVQVMTELQKGRSKFDTPEEPPVDYSDEEEQEMMSPTPATPSGASGGDVRGTNGDVRRRPRRLESIADLDLTQTIGTRVRERQRIDTDLQFRDQTFDEVGEYVPDQQAFKRPGAYDWKHRYTGNTLTRAMMRQAQRQLTNGPEDNADRKARSKGRYKKHDKDGGHTHRKHHRRDRSNSNGRSEERSHDHRRPHNKHRHRKRRTDIGPNTHVIQGGELETHLLRRLDRWKTRNEDTIVSHF